MGLMGFPGGSDSKQSAYNAGDGELDSLGREDPGAGQVALRSCGSARGAGLLTTLLGGIWVSLLSVDPTAQRLCSIYERLEDLRTQGASILASLEPKVESRPTRVAVRSRLSGLARAQGAGYVGAHLQCLPAGPSQSGLHVVLIREPPFELPVLGAETRLTLGRAWR